MHRTRNPANRLEIGAQVQILYSPLEFLFTYKIGMKLQKASEFYTQKLFV